MEVADLEYFEDLVRGVLRHVGQLDAALRRFPRPRRSTRSIRSSAPCCASPRIELRIASTCRTGW